MNIERMLRIAKEQPWWNSYVKNVRNQFGSLDKFLKKLNKESDADDFFTLPFSWRDTKEGLHFWEKVCIDTCEKYRDTSVKIFIREPYGKVRVAKLIDAAVDDEPRFISALKDTRICYDSIESEGMDLVAYKNSYKIVEEWM